MDILVAQWGGDRRIYALNGIGGSALWFSDLPQNEIYHNGGFADIDENGKPEVIFGSYDNNKYTAI